MVWRFPISAASACLTGCFPADYQPGLSIGYKGQGRLPDCRYLQNDQKKRFPGQGSVVKWVLDVSRFLSMPVVSSTVNKRFIFIQSHRLSKYVPQLDDEPHLRHLAG